MNKCKILILILAILVVVDSGSLKAEEGRAPAQKDQKKPPAHRPPVVVQTPSAKSSSSFWASKMGAMDFSAVLGLYNPGTGIEALGAYRLHDGFLGQIDDSLSVETGLGYYGASQTFAGVSSSYSIFQIPVMARWDLHFMDQKLIVGPRAGFAYLLGGSATVNGTTYTASNAGFNFQVGAFGMYRFTDQIAARAGITFGGFTAIHVGATYFMF